MYVVQFMSHGLWNCSLFNTWWIQICSELFLILTFSKWYFLQRVDSKDFTSMVQQNKVTKLTEINPHFSCVHYTLKLCHKINRLLPLKQAFWSYYFITHTINIIIYFNFIRIFHNVVNLLVKKKGKVVPVHNMKAYMGSSNIAPLILNLGYHISSFPLTCPLLDSKISVWAGFFF